ncbi:unnamed protein product [Rotaria magnacalcarata]
MHYPYSISPYIQTNMAQAMQAMMGGGPLPPNCVILAMPMKQAHQMFPQLMMNYGSGSGGGGGGGGGGVLALSQPPSYYSRIYQPQIGPYPNNPQSNALVPYSSQYAQGYNQNYNYPIVPYTDHSSKSKRKHRPGAGYRSEPHSNVYNSSSFDTHMENLSWSRLFNHHHHHHHHHHQHHQHDSKQRQKNQGAISYEPKGAPSKAQQPKAGNARTLSTLSSTSSSSTPSDESIRRVTVTVKPPTDMSMPQPQTNGSLPFKYSSEFVPGSGKQSSQKLHKKDTKVRSDDVFIIKKTQPPQPSTKK